MKPAWTRQGDRSQSLGGIRLWTELTRNWTEPETADSAALQSANPASLRAQPAPGDRRAAEGAEPAWLAPPRPRAGGGRASGHVTAAQVSTASGSGFGVAAGSRFHSLGCAGDYGVLLRPCRHRTRGSWRPRPGIRLRLQNQEEAFRAAESEGVPGRRPAGGRVPVGRRPLGKNRPGPPLLPLGLRISRVLALPPLPRPACFPAHHSRVSPGWLLVWTLVSPYPFLLP